MCALIFNTVFVWKNSHCEKNWARYDQKCILVWNKKPTRCHLVLYLFLLYKLLNMFRATLSPSSGADDLVVFFHVWCSAMAV